MRVFGFFSFRHFGRRFCGLFSYEFISFFEQKCFFNESVCFLASGILEDGSVAFFHMNLSVFLKQKGFFNESVGFSGFRHFGRRFCGLFSCEFIRFFCNRIVFSMRVLFWLQAFWKTVLWPFFI